MSSCRIGATISIETADMVADVEANDISSLSPNTLITGRDVRGHFLMEFLKHHHSSSMPTAAFELPIAQPTDSRSSCLKNEKRDWSHPSWLFRIFENSFNRSSTWLSMSSSRSMSFSSSGLISVLVPFSASSLLQLIAVLQSRHQGGHFRAGGHRGVGGLAGAFPAEFDGLAADLVAGERAVGIHDPEGSLSLHRHHHQIDAPHALDCVAGPADIHHQLHLRLLELVAGAERLFLQLLVGDSEVFISVPSLAVRIWNTISVALAVRDARKFAIDCSDHHENFASSSSTSASQSRQSHLHPAFLAC